MRLDGLTLKLRKNLPSWVRRTLRLARHAVTRGAASATLPGRLLADCRMCASRYELVAALPRGGRVAEIGTDKGEFAQHILAVCSPVSLHLIDLDFSALLPALRENQRVHLHEGSSHELLAAFPDEHFDWIYIDADHSYTGVTRDANAAAAKVKKGGYLVFNDFAHMDPFLGAYGVHRAVVDFAVSKGWEFAWFAYDPMALYDVALRRPHSTT
ncbi:MAG: class I SAM-dependent methyltransferase [Xanthobacteraceae bacterium]|nr:class I SAM-dependent methyltransferase [Xanthobacteraceae bacterium]